MANSFTAQVRQANERTKEALRNIMRASIQDVMIDAQTPVAQGGNMPVDTSLLRNSLASGINGSFGAEGGDSYALAIAGMDIGDTANFAWTAVYARKRHYLPAGDGRQGSGMWRDKAAQRFQEYVDRNAARLL